jgi:hypothetical protein
LEEQAELNFYQLLKILRFKNFRGDHRTREIMAIATIKDSVIDFTSEITETGTDLFANKVGLIGKLFGCGHGDLSRPFSQGKVGYRSCLKCGAVKQFNLETLETFGGFYYPTL